MPVTNGIGHGDYTHHKHEHLAGILRMHLDICAGIARNGRLARWWYLDLNAGDGTGSPYVAWSVLAEKSPCFPTTCVFVEHNPETYAQLAAMYDGVDATCCPQRNRDVLARLAPSFRGADHGIAFHDPNGEVDFDLDMLRQLRNTKIDVVIYYAATAHKRMAAAFQDKRGVRLASITAQDIKPHWLIRVPEGAHQWTMLIGTGWADFPAWERRGFYRLHSPRGQDLFDRLNHTTRERNARNPQLPGFNEPPYRTYREYLRHPRFLAVRAEVMQRAGGVCEVCRGAAATQVHHLRYPKWGTFDTPENLQAICYPCHCRVHGKDS